MFLGVNKHSPHDVCGVCGAVSCMKLGWGDPCLLHPCAAKLGARVRIVSKSSQLDTSVLGNFMSFHAMRMIVEPVVLWPLSGGGQGSPL